jgi:hypothetical protein
LQGEEKKRGPKSALGSLGLVRQKVGPQEGSLYRDQPRTTRSGKSRLQPEIQTTDRQIDQLAYEFCELTEGEITLVEEAT